MIKPLTWDELWDMDRRPVYIDNEAMYAIVYVDHYDDEIYLNGIDDHGEPLQIWISRNSDMLKHIYTEMP